PLRSAAMLPLRLVCPRTIAVNEGVREASVPPAAMMICRRRALDMRSNRERDAHLCAGRGKHSFGRRRSGTDGRLNVVIAEKTTNLHDPRAVGRGALLCPPLLEDEAFPHVRHGPRRPVLAIYRGIGTPVRAFPESPDHDSVDVGVGIAGGEEVAEIVP